MKVLLISPVLTIALDDPAGVNPMLGLAYLAAYLEKNDFEVEILDAAAEGINNVRKVGSKLRYGLGEGEIKKRIKKSAPAIVGITNPSTLHAADAHDIAKMVKDVDEDILVVFGGAHASACPELVLADGNVDLVVKGEGEETFLEVVSNFCQGASVRNIAGTHHKEKGKIVQNPMRPFIRNLDSLSYPARHLLPMDIYLESFKKNLNYLMCERATTLISSRGCPGNCIYCAVKTVWGRKWRCRSAKNVVDEMEHLINDYDIGEVHFLDDSISVDRDHLGGICDEIINRGLDIKWTTPNGIAIWLLDKSLIKKMKRAGCYRLTFGLESGNSETLKFMRKKYDLEYAKEVIRYAHRIGLWTVGTFIIGFPYEQADSIEDTINFAVHSHLDFAVFYIANPFPGTDLYEIFRREGLLSESDFSSLVRGTDTKYFKHQELQEIQGEAFSRFLKSRLKTPWRAFRKIHSGEDIKYTVKLAKNFSRVGLSTLRFSKRGIASLWR